MRRRASSSVGVPAMVALVLSGSLALLLAGRAAAAEPAKFEVVETTVTRIHEALRSRRLTCRRLVEAYLDRIRAYDQPTRLNAIVVLNPDALADADALDQELTRTGKLRPLHGVPIIVKDNYDTKGLQTTGGSLAMKGSLPPQDAYQVRKLREAGAIVLAKSNMAEWAFSPFVTVSSIAGITRNPYDLERVPAGSSGGTAAAVAASLGAIGLGTDTGNSIRGPSSHNALVGIRSTMGLTSRQGIIPLYLRNDIGGPMARTVEDAARLLDVIAGYDPADPITQRSEGQRPASYLASLDKDGLRGVRVGLLRRYVDTPTTDPEIRALTDRAVLDLRRLGAEVVDPFDIPDYLKLIDNIWCDRFQHDVNAYLATLGKAAPYPTIAAVFESGLYAPYVEPRLKNALEVKEAPEAMDPPCLDVYHDARNVAFRNAVLGAMEKDRLDAIVYPTWSNTPRKVGDMDSPAGDNSQYLSPQTGFPAVTVPMGFTHETLPAGLTFLARAFAEPQLIKMAYAYEQGTKHRRPPAAFPELR
jgi:amidase